MDIDGVTTLLRRPDRFLIVFSLQGGGIFSQAKPPPTAVFGDEPHLAVFLQPTADIPATLLRRFADAPAVVPAVNQQVRVGAWNGLKLLDLLHSHIHFAQERHAFLLTDGLLAVQPRPQRAATPQQDVQPGEQTMTAHHFFLDSRVVPTHAAHLPPFRLAVHRIVKDQVTGHKGCLWTSLPFRTQRSLADMFGLHGRLHLLPKTAQPDGHDPIGRPGPAAQKTRQATQADCLCDTAQESGEGTSLFAFHQPQQYDHKVRPLAPAEARAKGLQKLAQSVGKAYNRLGHGPPPRQWLARAYHYPRNGPCPLLCYGKVQG